MTSAVNVDAASPHGGWADLITQHLQRYPAAQPQDIYKLIYQGTRGPEHIISSAESFMAWLGKEWDSLAPNPAGLLYEPVRPDGSLLRLHLAPFKAAGRPPDRLGELCLRTGQHVWGSQGDLRVAWAAFLDLCQKGTWPGMDFVAVQELAALVGQNGYPALHHSDAFRQAYRPAYRLLAVDYLALV